MILSKQALDASFAGIFRSLRPAFFSSVIMAASVLGARSLVGYSGGGADLLLGLSVGVVGYYLSLRLLFADKLQDALSLLFGNRFARLRPGK